MIERRRAKFGEATRYLKAHRETIEWMYSSEDSLKIYADCAGVSLEEPNRYGKNSTRRKWFSRIGSWAWKT